MSLNALRYSGTNREWFVDPRGPDRRLQVTCHGDARRVVLSIWRGDACTATFQLPLDDAPRMIAHLADCLTMAMDRHSDAPIVTGARLSTLERARTAIERMAARLRR